MKIFVMGYKESGKDTVARLLEELAGLTWMSSSDFAMQEFLLERLQELGYPFQTAEEVHAAKLNDPELRRVMHDEIVAYNGDDRTRLAEGIFLCADVYVGIRNGGELAACKRRWGDEVFCIWVDASLRVPPEDIASCSVSLRDADIIINNNDDEATLRQRIAKLARLVRKEQSYGVSQ